ncbi:MAG TPA: right-handed parallel beta-helix repeat-containing protein [Fimbriimonadaceae bacterium]|jgi:predicted outer membrane repeat protein
MNKFGFANHAGTLIPGTLPKLAVMVLASLTCTAALATNWYVSPTGSDSNPGTASNPLQLIQTALNDAHLTGDTIWLEAGTYTGVGNVDLTVSKTVTITSVAGASGTIIDCGPDPNNHIAITFSAAGSTSNPAFLENISIENGIGGSDAGAINVINSSVFTITNCVFTKNSSNGDGGAIFTDATSTLVISNSSFGNNGAVDTGGAVYNLGNLTVGNSIFSNNNSLDAGAIYNSGPATITNCSFLSNHETEAGVIENAQGGGLELTGCTVSANSASNGVSGLFNDEGQFTAKNCEFSQNVSTQEGGGIYTNGYPSLIENCIIVGNSAIYGGGIYINGSVNVVGCTITGNTASSSILGGGAIYVDSKGNATLMDDILWGDSAPSVPSTAEIQVSGGLLNITYSDVALAYSGQGNIQSNPLFLSSSNYHIQPASPCLYTGSAYVGLTTDYAGRLRHTPTSMGAYEGGSLWTPVASAISPNQNKRLLWCNLSGEAALWTITPSGGQSALAFGPFAGYTPVALAVGPDNNAYLAWQQASGELAVWDIAANGTHTDRAFNPGVGWSLVSLSVGSDSYLHITWQDKVGHFWIWNVSTSGTIQYQEYGPE